MSAPERARVLERLGVEHGFAASDDTVPRDLVRTRQVHGTTLLRVPLEGKGAEADALWTDRAGSAVGVATADCVPILLAHRSGRIVCAIHAGWRGSAARIAWKSVRALCAATGTKPGELAAAIGPHIGPCCYEVDAPVIGAIRELCVFRPAARPGHAMLDLFALNRLQLVGAGVPARAIERVGGCTLCAPARYPSYRRDRGQGRMLHFVRVTG